MAERENLSNSCHDPFTLTRSQFYVDFDPEDLQSCFNMTPSYLNENMLTVRRYANSYRPFVAFFLLSNAFTHKFNAFSCSFSIILMPLVP